METKEIRAESAASVGLTAVGWVLVGLAVITLLLLAVTASNGNLAAVSADQWLTAGAAAVAGLVLVGFGAALNDLRAIRIAITRRPL